MSEKDIPVYRATAQTYLDRLYEPGDTVTWAGLPNAALEPLNEAAEMAMLEAEEARSKHVATISPSPSSFDAVASRPAEPPAGETRVGELEAQVSDLQALLAHAGEIIGEGEARISELEAIIKPFDGNGDGKPGGSAKKGA